MVVRVFHNFPRLHFNQNRHIWALFVCVGWVIHNAPTTVPSSINLRAKGESGVFWVIVIEHQNMAIVSINQRIKRLVKNKRLIAYAHMIHTATNANTVVTFSTTGTTASVVMFVTLQQCASICRLVHWSITSSSNYESLAWLALESGGLLTPICGVTDTCIAYRGCW